MENHIVYFQTSCLPRMTNANIIIITTMRTWMWIWDVEYTIIRSLSSRQSKSRTKMKMTIKNDIYLLINRHHVYMRNVNIL